MTIRDYRHTDFEGALRLLPVAMPDEMRAGGLTPQGAESLLRRLFMGQMVLFRLLTALAGIKWGIVLAEEDGQIVGGGGFFGKMPNLHLDSLMVLPAYRRRGVGEAITRARVAHIAQLGCKHVTAHVLNSSQAGLGNLHKCGFEIFHQSSNFDLTKVNISQPTGLSFRPPTPADLPQIRALELAIEGPQAIAISGSITANLFPSTFQRFYNHLRGLSYTRQLVEAHGQLVGLLSLIKEKGDVHGHANLLVNPNDQSALRAMIAQAIAKFTQQDINKLTIGVAGEINLEQVAQMGGQPETLKTWFALVKHL